MKCWGIHAWGPWEGYRGVSLFNINSGARITPLHQRTCIRCGKVQER